MSRRLLLCIGCQKGGTSWLSTYLRDMPEVRLGVRKEMHVLDVHHLDASRDWHIVRIARAEAQIAKLRASDANPRSISILEDKIEGYRKAQSLTDDIGRYVAYFQDVAGADPGVEVVADLTPDYCLLRAEHWRAAKAHLDRSGFAVKVLFIMRDPVERLDSAWRMLGRDTVRVAERGSGLLRRAALRGKALARHLSARVVPPPAAAPFLEFAMRGQNLARSRYDETIEAVEAVFPAEDIHYEFYETLFTTEAIAQIDRFLGLPGRPADFGARVNASPLQMPVGRDEVARVREMLEPTYRFCAGRFGAERLAAIWKNHAVPAPVRTAAR